MAFPRDVKYTTIFHNLAVNKMGPNKISLKLEILKFIKMYKIESQDISKSFLPNLYQSSVGTRKYFDTFNHFYSKKSSKKVHSTIDSSLV